MLRSSIFRSPAGGSYLQVQALGFLFSYAFKEVFSYTEECLEEIAFLSWLVSFTILAKGCLRIDLANPRCAVQKQSRGLPLRMLSDSLVSPCCEGSRGMSDAYYSFDCVSGTLNILHGDLPSQAPSKKTKTRGIELSKTAQPSKP